MLLMAGYDLELVQCALRSGDENVALRGAHGEAPLCAVLPTPRGQIYIAASATEWLRPGAGRDDDAHDAAVVPQHLHSGKLAQLVRQLEQRYGPS